MGPSRSHSRLPAPSRPPQGPASRSPLRHAALLAGLLLAACTAPRTATRAPAGGTGAPRSAQEAPRAEEGAAGQGAPGAQGTATGVPVEGDGFRVSFPAPPHQEASMQETGAGLAATTTWSLAPSEGEYLAVSATHFPEGTVSTNAPEKVLAGARDGALANVQGTLVREEAVRVRGPRGGKPSYPGLDYQATSGQGLRVSTRLLVVGDTLYQLLYVRTGEDDAPFRQLVGSFALR